MQNEKQRYQQSAEGQHCTGVIISDHWVATSEKCCENAAGAILDFFDDRTGSSGSGSGVNQTKMNFSKPHIILRFQGGSERSRK